MKIDHFIHGEFISSTATFNKLNPFNFEVLYTVSSATPIELVKTIQSGQNAFSDWKSTTLIVRLQFLEKIKIEYINFKNEIIKFESIDQGLPTSFTEKANYEIGLKIINRLIIELKNEIEAPLKNILFSPIGLIAVILSWNLSNRLFVERALVALMAGNAVIVKCSSLAPTTAHIWAQIFKKIGLPAGIIQFVHSADQAVKDLLVTHPSIKAISFTGTLKNGTDILKKTAQLSHNQFKKIQISTGTKNPAIALAEPSQKLSDEVFDSFVMGQGQLAWNSARLFILEKHAVAWNEYLAQYLDNINPLENIDQDSPWSPILRKNSVNIFNEIQKTAKSDQAKLIFSNHIEKIPENYLRPTFTKDMSNCSTLQQDQVQAPLYILSEVKYPFDIPKYSNVSYYGFTASIWAESDKAIKVVEALDVGLVSLNRWAVYCDQTHKSVKQSAYGIQDYHIFGDFFSNVKILS